MAIPTQTPALKMSPMALQELNNISINPNKKSLVLIIILILGYTLILTAISLRNNKPITGSYKV